MWDRAIIMREYNSGQKQSDRIYLVLQRIVIRKNAKFWRLHLRDVGSNDSQKRQPKGRRKNGINTLQRIEYG